MPVFHQQLVLIAAMAMAWLVVAILFTWLVRRRWTKRTPGRERCINIMLVGLALGAVWVAGEFYLTVVAVPTDGFSFTMSSRIWLERYWQPLNAGGYRDSEHPPDRLQSRKRVVMLGASFAAGGSIRNIDDRYAGVLGQRLGESWEVVTIAKPGWSTVEQAAALDAISWAPTVVVLSYCPSDIEGVARSRGKPFPVPEEQIPPRYRLLVANSNLANYLYWRVRRVNQSIGDRYWQHLQDCYRDREVRGELDRLLAEIAARCRRDRALFVALVFPYLNAVEASAPLLATVKEQMRTAGAVVIDVGALAGSWPPAERIVSPADPHPSAALHRALGNELAATIIASHP